MVHQQNHERTQEKNVRGQMCQQEEGKRNYLPPHSGTGERNPKDVFEYDGIGTLCLLCVD